MTEKSPKSSQAPKDGREAESNGTEDEFPKVIQGLADEEERRHKKSYTRWIDSHLKQHDPPTEIEDLFEDIKRGLKLIYLLEVLSSEKIPLKDDVSKMTKFHFRDNINKALEFLKKKKIPLENINSPDLVEGKPKIVLALIWSIILHFQVQKPTSGPASDETKAHKLLLEWAQMAVTRYQLHRKFSFEVRDFSKSWRNGYAFTAVIYYINPELVDVSKLPNYQNKQRLDLAFRTGEDRLGISRILDPEDVDVEKPDERSIKIYVAMLREYAIKPEQEARTKSESQVTEPYEDSHKRLSQWLKDAERKAKDFSLVSTLEDKRAQVKKFRDFQQNIASRQPDFKTLVTKAKQMHARDSEVAANADQLNTRYQTLRASIEKRIAQLEDNVTKHQEYQTSYSGAIKWLNDVTKRLAQCADIGVDRQEIEKSQSQLLELVQEKEQGAAQIHTTIQQGEHLYPHTAPDGQDIIREELQQLKERWESFTDQLSDTQRKLEVCRAQLSSYEDSLQLFQAWMGETETKLKADTALKATLQEKKVQLQSHKVQHQDILSRQHVLDSLADSAKSLAQPSGSDIRMARHLKATTKHYKDLCDVSQDHLQRFENNVADHQQYHDALHQCKDQLTSLRDNLCTDGTGDKFAVQNKLDRARELISQTAKMEPKLKNVSELCDKTITNTSNPGRETLKQEMNGLQADCVNLASDAEDAQADLQGALRQWEKFDSAHETLLQWLTVTEQELRNLQLKSSLEEKQEQVARLKTLKSEIDAHQTEMDGFTDLAQALLQTSADTRLNTYVSQAKKRYRDLQGLLKECLTKWEKYAVEHARYRESYTSFTLWVKQVKEKVDGLRNDSEDITAEIKAVTASKKEGLQKLTTVKNQGERLYPDTATAGHDQIQKELRAAKYAWDGLAQRLQAWSIYKTEMAQLEKWFLEVEAKFTIDITLKNTLEEKRAQLENNKAVLEDVRSHSDMVNSVVDKAQALLQQMTRSSEVEQFIKGIKNRYQIAVQNTKEAITESQNRVTEHDDYEYAHQAAREWLKVMQRHLKNCADFTGDKQSIDKKLTRVQNLQKQLQEDGSPKIQTCIQEADTTSKHTAEHGRKTIADQVESLRDEWQRYQKELSSTHDQLQAALQQWKKYEDFYERLGQWLKNAEKKAKDDNLVSTLEEKRARVKEYQALQQDIDSHQPKFEKLDDMAEQMKVSEFKNAPNPSKLNTRYQTLRTDIKVVVTKWENYVTKHEKYQTKYSGATKWLNDATKRLAQCEHDWEEKREIKKSLSQLQETKKEGKSRISAVHECAEKTLPQTAAEGKKQIREELRRLKMDWDEYCKQLKALKKKLDGYGWPRLPFLLVGVACLVPLSVVCWKTASNIPWIQCYCTMMDNYYFERLWGKAFAYPYCSDI